MPNAAALIMDEVNGLRTAGKTPLTDAVAQAVDILEFRHKPGVVVVLTDGEETCGRSARALGKQIRKSAAELTVHVIAFRNGNFAWTGEQSTWKRNVSPRRIGLYVTVETQEELVSAFQNTLGCPVISDASIRWDR
jgi:Ca-activated chloride channel family protein